MKQKPVFLGTVSTLVINSPADGKHLRFNVTCAESPQAAPIEFIMTVPLSMQVLAALSDLQQKHGWSIPKGKAH